MTVVVNGVQREIAGGATVAEVLADLGAPRSGVAVALNGEVVPRAVHGTTVIPDGAVIEVLTAVQGG